MFRQAGNSGKNKWVRGGQASSAAAEGEPSSVDALETALDAMEKKVRRLCLSCIHCPVVVVWRLTGASPGSCSQLETGPGIKHPAGGAPSRHEQWGGGRGGGTKWTRTQPSASSMKLDRRTCWIAIKDVPAEVQNVDAIKSHFQVCAAVVLVGVNCGRGGLTFCANGHRNSGCRACKLVRTARWVSVS